MSALLKYTVNNKEKFVERTKAKIAKRAKEAAKRALRAQVSADAIIDNEYVRGTREKETEGRPQDLPEKLEAFHPPCVGGPERETGAWAGSLRISARGRPDAMAARRERVLGPLWLPPPFSFCRLRFTFECAD